MKSRTSWVGVLAVIAGCNPYLTSKGWYKGLLARKEVGDACSAGGDNLIMRWRYGGKFRPLWWLVPRLTV
jgi:hypothetical protein